MNRKLQILTVCLFAGVLLAFALGFWILPDNAFSPEENRSLKTFPKFTWERLASGEFGDDMNTYFADQFPLRDALVGLKGYCELALGKGENNGVVLGSDGQLQTQLFDVITADGEKITDTDAHDPAHVQKAIDGILRAGEGMQVPFSVMLTGRVADVTVADSAYPTAFRESLYRQLHEGLDGSVTYLDTVPMLRQRHEAGESVYYKTDHHWTTLGAYYAYCEVMKSFSMEAQILPAADFQRQQVVSFYGTAWSAGGMKFVPPDVMELWYLGDEADYRVTADGRVLDSMYSLHYLDSKDKYSVFLDGTHDVVTVEKPGEERPTLVLFKDSFANSMAPFLARHFNLVLINLSSRQDHTHITSLARQYNADYTLLVYSVENILTADKMGKLR